MNRLLSRSISRFFFSFFGLVFALIIDPYITKRNKHIMLISAAIVMSLIIQQMSGTYFEENSMTFARLVTSVYGYCIRPAIICMFMPLFGDYRKPWILIGINAVVYSTAFFTDIAFRYDADQVFRRGPLGLTCHIISDILLIRLAIMSIKKDRSPRPGLSVFPLITVALIAAGTLADTLIFRHYVIDILTVVTVSSCLFYYIWLHLQFVAKHERDLKAEQRIKGTSKNLLPPIRTVL